MSLRRRFNIAGMSMRLTKSPLAPKNTTEQGSVIRLDDRPLRSGLTRVVVTLTALRSAARPPRDAWGPRVRPRKDVVVRGGCCCARSIAIGMLLRSVHRHHSDLTAWPPNSLRRAAMIFALNDSSWREEKRDISDAVITGAGTS